MLFLLCCCCVVVDLRLMLVRPRRTKRTACTLPAFIKDHRMRIGKSVSLMKTCSHILLREGSWHLSKMNSS